MKNVYNADFMNLVNVHEIAKPANLSRTFWSLLEQIVKLSSSFPHFTSRDCIEIFSNKFDGWYLHLYASVAEPVRYAWTVEWSNIC